MKKNIFKFLFPICFSLLILLSPTKSFAQNELMFGQSHYYTVVFRGNGEAIVFVKMAITNPNDYPLNQISLEVPRVTPSELVMYQMKLPQRCVKYDYNSRTSPQTCLEYADPNYEESYYYYDSYGKAEYTKINYAQSGNFYNVLLPTSVPAYKSTAVIIAYAAKGYVRERSGLFTFNFETIKVPSRIKEVKVAVNVDSDLILKGKKSSVNYNSYGSKAISSQELAFSAPSLDNVVREIGSYGPVVKEAKNLAPNESFNVKGEYATSWLRLYMSSIFLVIGVIAGIFIALHYLSKYLDERQKKNPQPPMKNVTNLQMPKETVQPAQPVEQMQISGINVMNIRYAGAGLFSSLSFIASVYALQFINPSSMPFLSNLNPIFGVVILISFLLFFLLIIFGPAIYMASKYGWKALISVIIAEFLWFVIITILYIAFFNSGYTPGGGNLGIYL